MQIDVEWEIRKISLADVPPRAGLLLGSKAFAGCSTQAEEAGRATAYLACPSAKVASESAFAV